MGLLDKLRAALAGPGDPAPAAPPPGAAQARATQLIDEGNALEERGNADAASARYAEALVIAPRFPRAHLNVGNDRLARGDVAGAVAAYEAAVALDPGYAAGHFNLGNAHAQAWRAAEALAAYERAIAANPAFADAHIAAGNMLSELKRSNDAVARYRRALDLEPGYAAVHTNLGLALKELGRFDEAIDSHRRALALDPRLALAHDGLGNALKDVGRLDEAEASFRRAVELDPDRLDARSNLLFCHNYAARHAPAELLAEARDYGARVAQRARPYRAWRGGADPTRPLRVGLVSGDLRDHPVGYFLVGVLEAIATAPRAPADRLELIAYATAPGSDATAARIHARCAAWHDVGALSDERLAARIHDDAIDILVDLSGHSAHHRLAVFAWKPAPVQASWLGYFATTGVAEIDYLVADPASLPPAFEPHFSERIWRLPETRLCFSPPEASPPVAPLPALQGEALTFGCFNNLTKMGDEVVALWARVLAALPASRLLLKSPQLGDAAVRDAVARRFAAHGVAPARLLLEGWSPRADYLSRYAAVDIALDPYPFPGGTTTVEALWMGVPVLTLAGARFLARQGAGLLANAGLADWIADSEDDYVRRAVARASDLPALAALRRTLRPRLAASPVMDAARFAGHLEAAWRGMWQAWCASVRTPAR